MSDQTQFHPKSCNVNCGLASVLPRSIVVSLAGSYFFFIFFSHFYFSPCISPSATSRSSSKVFYWINCSNLSEFCEFKSEDWVLIVCSINLMVVVNSNGYFFIKKEQNDMDYLIKINGKKHMDDMLQLKIWECWF
jgi:hypothetical protein